MIKTDLTDSNVQVNNYLKRSCTKYMKVEIFFLTNRGSADVFVPKTSLCSNCELHFDGS